MKVPYPYPVIILLAAICGALVAPATLILSQLMTATALGAMEPPFGLPDPTISEAERQSRDSAIAWAEMIGLFAGGGALFVILATAGRSARRLKQRCFLAGIGVLALAATATVSLMHWLNALERGLPGEVWVPWFLCVFYLVLLGLVMTMASFCIPEPNGGADDSSGR